MTSLKINVCYWDALLISRPKSVFLLICVYSRHAMCSFLKGPFIILGMPKAMVTKLYWHPGSHNCGDCLLHHPMRVAVPTITCEMPITPSPKVDKCQDCLHIARLPWGRLSAEENCSKCLSIISVLGWDKVISLLLWLTFVLFSGRQTSYLFFFNAFNLGQQASLFAEA